MVRVEFLFTGDLIERGEVLVVRIDDFDAGRPESRKQIVEILCRSADLGRQKIADLIVQEVAFLLADIDQFLDLVLFLFETAQLVF